MSEQTPKVLIAGAALLCPALLAYFAFTRPGYFTNEKILGGLLLFEFLAVAIWFYRRFYFPVVLMTFLLAGVDLPVGTGWTTARWIFLIFGALVGIFILLRDRTYRFGLFHFIAAFAMLAAVISAAVSRYPGVALLKVLSLFLLFLYGSTGARVAVAGREHRFFSGLLLGCEIFVGANAFFYLVGIEAMGNPNSLGEVMGIAGVPILLWGALLPGEQSANRRRWALYIICLYLTVHSHARAGIAAAFISSAILCLALRRSELIFKGTIALTILTALTFLFRPEILPSIAEALVYKGSDQQQGLLVSRQSPWNTAVDNIREHPWFGMGLGTTAKGADPNDELGTFASSTSVTAENGSSYLALLSGVGVVGALPIVFMLLIIGSRVVRTIHWMKITRDPVHPAIPLAMVMVAGIIHATFEDWMFAPGNYMCVFFWSVAFIFADVSPSLPLLGRFNFRSHARTDQRSLGHVAPVR